MSLKVRSDDLISWLSNFYAYEILSLSFIVLFSILVWGFVLDAKKAIALVITLTFLALSFSGCLGSDNGNGGSGGDTPTQCAKPWPSKIDMIQIPDQMIVGETYLFQCQMFVQNYYNCTPSPWWYAVDTPIEWNFTNNGTTITNESLTNNPYGIASVNFTCPSASNWTVVAHWAGNENYVQAEGQANVSASDSCMKPWPSKVDIISKPDNMQVGQTYTFQARLWVQNKNPDCSVAQMCHDPNTGQALDWCYGTNTLITWTFSSSSASSEYQSTTDSSGIARITLTPSVGGTYHIVAQWAGNEAYVSSSGSADVSCAQPVQCYKPWPSRIDMIQAQSQMDAWKTYTFQCQMYVQNFDTYCNLSPWWYAVNTPITWTFTSPSGAKTVIDSTTNDPYGIATVQFTPNEVGQWTVVARWAGNGNYIETQRIVTIQAVEPIQWSQPIVDGFYECQPIKYMDGEWSIHDNSRSSTPTVSLKADTYYRFSVATSLLVPQDVWGALHDWTKTNGYWDPSSWTKTDQWRMGVSPPANLELYFDRQIAIHNGGMAYATMDNGAYMLRSLPNASWLMEGGNFATYAWFSTDYELITFHSTGSYVLTFWIWDTVSGKVVSPITTVNVVVT